jgi:hypothetical protein
VPQKQVFFGGCIEVLDAVIGSGMLECCAGRVFDPKCNTGSFKLRNSFAGSFQMFHQLML